MSSLSLARIMYGTSEDTRTATWMNANAATSRLTSFVIPDSSRGNGIPRQDTLGGLLHKAWRFLSTRH